jgi:flagellar biosynthesis protein FlhA
MLVLEPAMTEVLIAQIGKQVEVAHTAGNSPICICSPNIRLALNRLLEVAHSSLVVVSYNEIMPDVEIISTGMVRLTDDN